MSRSVIFLRVNQAHQPDSNSIIHIKLYSAFSCISRFTEGSDAMSIYEIRPLRAFTQVRVQRWEQDGSIKQCTQLASTAFISFPDPRAVRIQCLPFSMQNPIKRPTGSEYYALTLPALSILSPPFLPRRRYSHQFYIHTHILIDKHTCWHVFSFVLASV